MHRVKVNNGKLDVLSISGKPLCKSGAQLELGDGRKIIYGSKYCGKVHDDCKRISWNNGSITWNYLGDLPDIYDAESRGGRFKYTKLLGQGAHGIVCAAYDMCSGTDEHGVRSKVAVKVLKKASNRGKTRARLHCEYLWSYLLLHNAKHTLYEPSRASLFMKYLEDHTGLRECSEAELLRPDLISWLEAQRNVPELPYVVMEIARGDLLWNCLEKRKGQKGSLPAQLNGDQKREVFRQLISALEYMGKFQLQHYDLRFHNMFVCQEGHLQLCIIDLGMMGHRCQSFTLSPHNEAGWRQRDWLPWEVWQFPEGSSEKAKAKLAAMASPLPQDAEDINHQAFDVFSTGVILLYMCLGQKETREILDKIYSGEKPESLRIESSKALFLEEGMALKMISKDPHSRPVPAELMTALVKPGAGRSILKSVKNLLGKKQHPDTARSRSRSRSPRGSDPEAGNGDAMLERSSRSSGHA